MVEPPGTLRGCLKLEKQKNNERLCLDEEMLRYQRPKVDNALKKVTLAKTHSPKAGYETVRTQSLYTFQHF